MIGPRLEPIYPARFDKIAFDRKISRWLTDTAKLIERDYKKTIDTWEVKPGFKTRIVNNDKEASVLVYTEDEVYRFLHDGTSVRYAVMSSRFTPKTRVNRLVSVAGRGGRTHFDFENPRPGIQARNWTQRIIKLREKKITNTLQNAIKGAVRESNHAR